LFKVLVFSLLLAGCVDGAPRNDNTGAAYVGAKYVADPLGEAAGYDRDPLIRFDAFDCTTFVETVLAGGDIDALTRIRYADGEVSFIKRNHFIETDWMQNNSDIVKNVSSKYAKTAIRDVTIDKAAWFEKMHGMQVRCAPQTARLEYIPYGHLSVVENTVPLIVLFVVGDSGKREIIGTDIAVAHMGILLPGGKILRHASAGRGVVDDDFGEYVKKRRAMSQYKNIGVALVETK